jgi:hypothetical protein
MNRTSIIAGLIAASGLACSAMGQTVANANIVISQVYGGGGNTGAPINADYVELRNRSSTTQSLSGLSVQYASTAGNFSGIAVLPAFTLQPGQYYLVRMSTVGGVGAALPTPDFSATPTIAMSANNGKVALVNGTTLLSSTTGCPLPQANIIDYVGYGSANCSEGLAAGALANTTYARRNNEGCTDNGSNAADFTVGTLSASDPRNSASTFGAPCGIDPCSTTNPAEDCNNNQVKDTCEIAGNASLDCNADTILDSCQVTANPGTFDCNANGVIDCADLRDFVATDADGNGRPDSCDGARAVEVPLNATCGVTTVRAESNGSAFFNVQGTSGGTNASYGALRFDIPAIVGGLPSGYTASKVYLTLVQSNAGFTAGGIAGVDPDNVEIFYTNNDTINITPPASGQTNLDALFDDFASDYPDRQSIRSYLFVRGANPPAFGTAIGNGQIENYKLFDSTLSNNAGATSVANELVAGTGQLTLLLNPIAGQDYVAATYTGRTNTTTTAANAGPKLVFFPGTGAPSCDSIDFNNDTLTPDSGDLDDFIAVLSGGPTACSTFPVPGCNDIDFNNDTFSPDSLDLDAFISRLSGGPCLQ